MNSRCAQPGKFATRKICAVLGARIDGVSSKYFCRVPDFVNGHSTGFKNDKNSTRAAPKKVQIAVVKAKSTKKPSPAQLAARAKFAAAARERSKSSKSKAKPAKKPKLKVAKMLVTPKVTKKSGKGGKAGGRGKAPTMTRRPTNTISEPTPRKSGRLFW